MKKEASDKLSKKFTIRFTDREFRKIDAGLKVAPNNNSAAIYGAFYLKSLFLFIPVTDPLMTL